MRAQDRHSSILLASQAPKPGSAAPIRPGFKAIADGIASAPSFPVRKASMPARKYPLSLDRIAVLERTAPKGVRVPTTPPGTGLPPKVVRYLRDFRLHKQGRNKDISWRVPGYRILSRVELLRR
jgi:hypothetical protein